MADQPPSSNAGASLDVVADKRAQLKALFPGVFTETHNAQGETVECLDFDKLKAELGAFTEAFEARRERYGLEWPGKKDALKLVQAPSHATLIPRREASVAFDDSRNLFIEGDNLEVLKLLQKPYHAKVKLIHIDPPYNTDGDFIYADSYAEPLAAYLAATGQADAQGRQYSSVSEQDGRYHSRWLNMIYPRLYLARNLLTDDGVILIHIDEHEADNLRLVLNELFGAENDLGEIIWDKRNPKGDSTRIASQHEKLLVYAKDRSALRESRPLKRPKANAERMIAKAARLVGKVGSIVPPTDLEAVVKKYALECNTADFARTYTLDDARREYREWLARQEVAGGEAAYQYLDDQGEVYRTVSMAWPNKRTPPPEYFKALIHPATQRPCPVPARGWRNSPARMAELLAADLIVFGADETKQPERKYYLKDNMQENVPSMLPFGGSDDALLKMLSIPFDNPKPVALVKSTIEYFTAGEGLVLDFFAGSASVGHACLELQQQGQRVDFILVQLPERLDASRAEQQAGVRFCQAQGLTENIAEIAKERLRRVIARNPHQGGSVSGFRTYTLAASHFRRWQSLDAGVSSQTLIAQLERHVDHVDPEATAEALLCEILLKAGIVPTEAVEVCEMAGLPVYSVAQGAWLICLARRITPALIAAVSQAAPKQFICLDAAFEGHDALKADATQTFAARDGANRTIFRTV
ncbi:site-specific DNA-methyltransferase [Halomonas sp. WWR20]